MPDRRRPRARRLRCLWDSEIGPRLRRAEDGSPTSAAAVDELIAAAVALRELGARDREGLELLIDQAAPATPFRATAWLAIVALELHGELGRRPSFDEVVRAAAADLVATEPPQEMHR